MKKKSIGEVCLVWVGLVTKVENDWSAELAARQDGHGIFGKIYYLKPYPLFYSVILFFDSQQSPSNVVGSDFKIGTLPHMWLLNLWQCTKSQVSRLNPFFCLSFFCLHSIDNLLEYLQGSRSVFFWKSKERETLNLNECQWKFRFLKKENIKKIHRH